VIFSGVQPDRGGFTACQRVFYAQAWTTYKQKLWACERKTEERMKYDVIIIGAGSAGCVLATRLTEDPQCSVLLLEVGPDYTTLEHYPDDLKYGYD